MMLVFVFVFIFTFAFICFCPFFYLFRILNMRIYNSMSHVATDRDRHIRCHLCSSHRATLIVKENLIGCSDRPTADGLCIVQRLI